MKFVLWEIGFVCFVVLSRWVNGFEDLNVTEVSKLDGYNIAPSLMVPLTLIQGADAKGAVCLDGTLPGYHWHRGYGSGANSWIVNLEAAHLHFRGQSIYVADMEELMSKGVRYANQALLSGCSVGGLATTALSDVSGGRTLRNMFGGVVSLQELEKLDHLEGKLSIKGLQYVLDPRDAHQANLRSKENFLDLHLLWPIDEYDIEIECNNSEEVLEALQPHPNIEVLVIEFYAGVMLPGWVGSSTALPKLTYLGIYDMPNVEGCLLLPPCLVSLHLYNCPKLKLPIPLPSSITSLYVGKANDPLLKSVEKLPNLFFLSITRFDEVDTLPEAPLQTFTYLQDLIITDCDKLKRLPTELENLSTIHSLRIYRCGSLESLMEGLQNLASLKDLVVFKCQSLKFLTESSLQYLTALLKFMIWDCPDLEIMLVDFQHLISFDI
ncbi:hypothetical protein IFM89_027358 [Coptis chinensis]|uniref:Pectin acetylesterase n=1 Tax=Coptis chinensis TaxID=261450 RepID=A0A835LFY7_9MAGN|nr:hypothetical protein IFM89_027358 [Coptis chinensis]